MADDSWLDAIKFDDRGLVTAVAQDAETSRILMVAWMDRAAIRQTIERGVAVYYSRSRQQLWQKGEQSGHTQRVESIELDCDGDVLVLKVLQQGGIACHTGRQSCFYRVLDRGAWRIQDPVIKDPADIYGDQ
ncbi:MAG: phosphoribosyl-AMP cyclohydrolase [Pseudomonadota bacterium]